MNASSSNRVRIALILVLVVAVAYLLLWRPQAAQVADLNSERDLLAEELAGLPPVGPSPEPGAAAPASTDAIALAVPPTDDLAELLRQFQSIAAEAGVEQTAVAAERPAALAGVSGASIPVTITVAGPRAAALDYVRRLGLLTRLVVVDSVSLEPSAEAQEAEVAMENPLGGRIQLNIAGRVFTTATPTTEATNG
jgi:Tfp pilus assembly protein PilO